MENNIELILINISGQDRPGVTSALTEILANYEANILDIGQADIHHTLSLGILFKTDSRRSGDILKERWQAVSPLVGQFPDASVQTWCEASQSAVPGPKEAASAPGAELCPRR